MVEEKQTFLITGSSGFLGHALAHHFGSKNHTIIGFDMEGPPYPPPNTEVLYCDLSSDESVQKTFHLVRSKNGNRIDAVFHLAAYYSFSGKDSPLYEALTVRGTERMLRELASFDVGQFIFSSSMLLHKPNKPGEKINEESPVEATWQYPQSKVEAEAVMHRLHGKIPIVNLRIAGVYDDVCHSIPLAHQIQRMYERSLEANFYSGDIGIRQSFLHMTDLVDCFERVVELKDQLPHESTFIIGEPAAMSYDEIQKEIAANLFGEEDWLTISVPKPLAKLGAYVLNLNPLGEKPFIKPWMIDRADDFFEVDISKARAILGWTPRHNLRTTLAKMIEGLKLDPIHWYKINHLHMPSWLKARIESKRNRMGQIAPHH